MKERIKEKIPKQIFKFAAVFSNAGFSCHLVGGAVRNLIAGIKPSNDYDFATDAQPQQVDKLFKKVIPTGIDHGTVTVLWYGYRFEVTTFRVDGHYSNLRHPDSISFSGSIKEDLNRRDFSINAMAYDLVNNLLLDPHNGREDLKNGVIKAIGNPFKRFSEDSLRLMRACRIATQLDFSICPTTFSAMQKTVAGIEAIASERIRDELIKILLSRRPSTGLSIMLESGLLRRIIPELFDCRGVEQGPRHDFDLFFHSLYSCDFAAPQLTLRLAALFHDMGKVVTKQAGAGGIPTFHRHEQHSALMAEKRLYILKFPTAIIKQCCHLINHHMFNYQPQWSDAAVRRFVFRVGYDNIDNLLALRYADQSGMRRQAVAGDTLADFKRRIKSVVAANRLLSLKDLAVDGNQLHQMAGIPRSRVMGVVLGELLQTAIDDPSQNNQRQLLEIARKIYQKTAVAK